VCALGPNLREEPLFFQHSVGPHPPERMVKASELTRWLLDMQEGGWERAKGWRVLIVGGGLTSAHLVNLAVANGLGHATLVTRSQMRSRSAN
jgi:cation diffusion facilitator CzcD-associated flavoprotein CzcO